MSTPTPETAALIRQAERVTSDATSYWHTTAYWQQLVRALVAALAQQDGKEAATGKAADEALVDALARELYRLEDEELGGRQIGFDREGTACRDEFRRKAAALGVAALAVLGQDQAAKEDETALSVSGNPAVPSATGDAYFRNFCHPDCESCQRDGAAVPCVAHAPESGE